MTKSRSSLACLIVCLFGLSGCLGSILESDAPTEQVYVIAPADSATPTATGTFDIAISDPAAAPHLRTERIAVLHADRRLDYYAAARWAGTAGAVMQSFIVESLQDQGAFRSVTAAPAGAAASYIVDFELRDFQAEYVDDQAAPAIRVSLVANVLKVADRRLVKVVTATASVQASANRMTAVVAAFETASREVTAALGRETAAALAADAGN